MRAKHHLLFVQGGGQGVHDEWDNKLVDSLQRELGDGYEIHYPRMPHEDDPSYARWKMAIEAEIQTLEDGAMFVGHSLGATVLLKLLTEQLPARKLAGIFLLAAPFIGAGGWSTDDLQFPEDLGTRLPQSVPIHFFHGLADEVVPPAHVELYARAVPHAQVYRLPGRDHQFHNDLNEVARAILACES